MAQGKVLLFAFPAMEPLAEKLMALNENYEHGTVRWDKFPDGTPNLMIENGDGIRNRDVLLLTSFRQPERWVEQVAVLYALPRYLAHSVTVLVPYFPTATMERVEEAGQVATAMTMARILSACPPTVCGPVRLVIFDIHTLQNRFYFGDSVIPCLLTALPLLMRELKAEEEGSAKKYAIAFPDEGAKKRFGGFFKGKFPMIVCCKERVGNERRLRLAEGSAQGFHCVIVDDLVQTGGTLRNCKNLLKGEGATGVSAFITHAVFPNAAWKNFIDDGWDSVYVTDSIPETAKDLTGKDPFKVLTIAPELDKYLFPTA